MIPKHICILLLLMVCTTSYGQDIFSPDPDKATFVTDDLGRFFQCFDAFKQDTSHNTFQAYLDKGSQGVTDYIPKRIKSAEHLFSAVKKNIADYDSTELHYPEVAACEKQCRASFYALKYWYPAAVFPSVYFVIGAHNSGGTSTDAGLIIGVEIQKHIADIPYIVAHELVHFQQRSLTNATLLQQSIVEGSADFIGELISGKTINEKAYQYGYKNKDRLCKEFVARMDSVDYTNWMYSTDHKDDRPNDLGYWMGYCICKAYFEKATDKHKAIVDILTVKDYKVLAMQSGFLKDYWKGKRR